MFSTIVIVPQLAVVPVFVNAGAALFPAMIAALTSVVALLLKPRELVQLFRKKPHIPILILVAAVAVYFLWGFFAHATTGQGGVKRETQAATVTTTDWTHVALEILRQEKLGTSPLPAASSESTPPSPGGALIYRGVPQRTGYGGGASPLKLEPLWEYHEEGTMYLSSPLPAGDVVYGASCYMDPPGSFGAIFCLDAATGKVRWITDVKDSAKKKEFMGFFSSPALSADRKNLVIGQGLHQDAGAELVCLDAQTGAVRWLVKTPLHIEGSPAIEGDIAVAGAGAVEVGPEHKPQGDPAGIGNPGYLFGVRISDGKELWRFQVNDPESSPAIADGIAYIGSGVNGSAVAAVRIAPDEELKAAGKERLVWKVPSPFPACGAVTLTEDLVLIGSGKGDFVFAAPDPEGVVLALEKATGNVRWSTKLPDAVLGAIAVKDGKAIVPVRNGELIALNLADGKILWRQEDPKRRISGTAPLLSGPAFTGKLIYASSQDGYLAIIDPANGDILEKKYLNAPDKPGEMGLSFSSPFVSDGRVYIGSETGGLRAFVGKDNR
ncbi:MAG: PQQ-binding-like beta-propeller repeat protein [Verrucomicrobiota bacterium]